MHQINEERGQTVKTTEHARKLSLAALCVAALCVIAGGLTTAAPALAAAPLEAPEASVEQPVRATEAVFHGVLNPKATEASEAGVYKFLYKAGAKCGGGNETIPGMALGVEHEELPSESVAGLVAKTEYTVCLSETNLAKTKTVVSPEVHFTTATPPQMPVAEAATGPTATTVTLHGELNPVGEAETGYYFLYSTEATCAAGGTESTPVVPANVKAKTKVEEKVEGLQPLKEYVFCLVATNSAGETAQSANELHFETLVAPPTIVSESTSSVKSTEARLEGVVNPNNQLTECHFQYGQSKASENTVPCEPGVLEGFGEDGVAANVSGLEAAKIYRYRIVAKNGKGEVTEGPEKEFKRLVAPPEAPTTEAVQAVTNTTAALHGLVNPVASSSVSWFFQYAAGSSCAGSGVSTTPAQGPEEVQAHPVEAELTGLQHGTEYTVCLVSENEAKEQTRGNGVSFVTSSLEASVGAESFSNVGSSSADLGAQVDPDGLETSYYFEYGPSEAYGSRTAEASLGEGESTINAPAQVEDLTPGTIYHFRIVVVNEIGVVQGTDATFKTLPLGVLGLPDGRAFERVTPVDNENADVYVPQVFGISFLSLAEGIETTLPFRAAADGDAVAYVGDSTSGGTGLEGSGNGNDYLSTRSSSGGWTQVNVQPPGYYTATYQAFSNDLSLGFVGAQSGAPGQQGFEEGLPALSPQAPGEGYQVLYARESSDGNYQPLITKAATLHRPASEFGAGGIGASPALASQQAPLYAGSSANLQESLFEANDALTAGAPSGSSEEDDIYVSQNGQLSLVNVLPDGSSQVNAIFGGQALEDAVLHRGDFSNVISADGSRVFWTQLEASYEPGGDIERERPKALYVRENPTSSDARTVQVDAAVGGGGDFWTATPDGSKVLFTKGELYEYNLESGETTDLTPGIEVSGVIGMSENGEYIYYVDENHNLEMWHDGALSHIATLSPEDGNRAGPFKGKGASIGDWQNGFSARTAEVTPDGSGVVFMSNQSLNVVGYPDGYPNDGMYEVYVYEAEGGKLFCVSCSPSGEPPQQNMETELGANPTAAFLPISWRATYQPRWISADGSKVFFDSVEPLVAQDTNGKQDVYEWERDGSGSCHEVAGCVYLLSGGTNGHASWLLDASESGNDVFIISRAELVPGDPYDSLDVYDARVGGVAPPTPPECSGTGCQGVPAAPPIFATPASVTFNGVGNFPPAPTVVTKTTRKKTAKCAGHEKRDKAGACKRQKSKRKSKKVKKADRKGRK